MKARERLIGLLDTSCGYKDDSKSQRDTYAAIRLIDELIADMAKFVENTAHYPTAYELAVRAEKLGYGELDRRGFESKRRLDVALKDFSPRS